MERFQAGQIIQVTAEERILYCEALSTVERSTEILCWARPLTIRAEEVFWDVRQAMDVIWPADWFAPAYDGELLAVWHLLDWEAVVYLGPSKEHLSLLQEFTQELYRQNYPAPRKS
jgi:hypothetical protein